MDQTVGEDRRRGAALPAETIFALASGAGRAAVAVMRLSGPDSGPILDRLCGRRPAARHASLRTLRGPTGEVLDRGLVLWFPGPASYTGEDSGELHLHGSRAVTGAVAEALAGWGARSAEAGEFTRRAFLNGRMDLLEAEGVADLVEAETVAQRRQALRQMEGALADVYCGWADRLRETLALQEALIDFSDDEVPEHVLLDVEQAIVTLAEEIASHLDDGHRGERVREGLVFALVGAPNVGKSSIINALSGREIAIVAPTPGTTRDVLEARVELGGYSVTLVDTAGQHASADPVEIEGIRRAIDQAERADLVIEIVDAAAPALTGREKALVVANKVDLVPHWDGPGLAVSARTGSGLDLLQARLVEIATSLIERSGPPPLTRERHRASLGVASSELVLARSAAWAELRSEHLRGALRCIGLITGEVGTEAILDAIFSRFCIGK